MRTETPVQIKLSDYTPYPFDIEQVHLSLALSETQTRVKSQLNVKRRGSGDMVLDGVDLTLNALRLDGVDLPEARYTRDENSLTLHDMPDSFVLDIDVTIDPSANTALSGLYVSGARLCTQCEATGFRRITYWPDRPDVMSRFQVRLEADQELYPVLLSNGTPGAHGALEAGRHFAEWTDPHPKPSYLFALCAGAYDIYRDNFTTMSGKTIDLAIHVDQGDADRAIWAMESLKASMAWDETVFGREYDLGVFNIVAVRDFNFGAMENKGLNIFNSAYVLADEATATDADFEAIESIVAHEYFHNWTGNRITCRDWFQLCLKEGLTVFRDQEFSADMRSRPVQRIKDVIRLRARQFAEDGGPLAHAVRPDHYASIDNLYTATVYEKGAELIRMLKTLIGEEAFSQGMQIYFDTYDGQATTIEHFYGCFEKASGENLSDFQHWYSQPGTPHITAEEQWDSAAGSLTLTLIQKNPETPGNPAPAPLPMPIKLTAYSPEGDTLAQNTVRLEGEKTEWTLSDLTARPLLSLNQGFSAPIKLTHNVSDATKLQTAQIDQDTFRRWDTFQSLLTRDLLGLAYKDQTAPDPDLISALGSAVRSEAEDPAFAALLARVPTVGEVFLEHLPADPKRLTKAYNSVQKALANTLDEFAQEVLQQPPQQPFDPGAEQAGRRALRSALINLLAATGTSGAAAQLQALFEAAPNMSERLTVLRALCVISQEASDPALQAFEKQWEDNELVLDKWFAVQAATQSTERVRALMQHPKFTLANPNRARSVIGVFAAQNLAQFHDPSGRGYSLVAEMIGKADARNPALAARLLQVFDQWRSLQDDSQKQAQKNLKALQEQKLSPHAVDIITRMLA